MPVPIHPLGLHHSHRTQFGRASDIALALELVEVLHQQLGVEDDDAAAAVAGVMYMDAEDLLKRYRTGVMDWVNRASKAKHLDDVDPALDPDAEPRA